MQRGIRPIIDAQHADGDSHAGSRRMQRQCEVFLRTVVVDLEDAVEVVSYTIETQERHRIGVERPIAEKGDEVIVSVVPMTIKVIIGAVGHLEPFLVDVDAVQVYRRAEERVVLLLVVCRRIGIFDRHVAEAVRFLHLHGRSKIAGAARHRDHIHAEGIEPAVAHDGKKIAVVVVPVPLKEIQLGICVRLRRRQEERTRKKRSSKEFFHVFCLLISKLLPTSSIFILHQGLNSCFFA